MPDAPIAVVRGFRAASGPVDLDVHAGDLVVLRGANGSGKSSLLRLLAGLPSPLAAASVHVAGRDPSSLRAGELLTLVHVAQQDARDGLVGLTVSGEFRLRGKTVPPQAAHLGDRDIATLSSGEARNVALLVAEAGSPRLLLLDEPTEGLDDERRARLVRLVMRARQHGAVVAADHGDFLDALATARIDLGGTALAPLPPIARGAGEAVLRFPGCTVRRGDGEVPLPATALAAGLHVVVGPNGCGKSTLLLHLAGLLGATNARVRGATPQPGHNVQLLLPRAGELFTCDTVDQELEHADAEVRAALVPAALAARHPLALSGGQAQRVALAKTLGRPAPLYLLDEPEAHLDGAGRAGLARLMSQRIEAGACILAATHDPEIIAAAQSRISMGGP
ncbi:MAG: ATP-binding cassette domain-containing protein [bacterium]